MFSMPVPTVWLDTNGANGITWIYHYILSLPLKVMAVLQYHYIESSRDVQFTPRSPQSLYTILPNYAVDSTTPSLSMSRMNFSHVSILFAKKLICASANAPSVSCNSTALMRSNSCTSRRIRTANASPGSSYGMSSDTGPQQTTSSGKRLSSANDVPMLVQRI